MSAPADLTEAKTAARKAAFATRKTAHALGQGAAAEHLARWLAPYGGKVLAGYMPMRTEIDPLPAMAAHRGPVAVPVILAPGQSLRFRAWHPGAEMIPGAFGAAIPATGDWLEPEVLIVPLLAFDARGFRLGYGGGFYDRTLCALRREKRVEAVGYAFAVQELPSLPDEPHDERLDAVVTDAGVIAVGAED